MKRFQWKRYLPHLIGFAMIAVTVLLIVIFRDVFEKPVEAKKQVQQIKVVQAPPPPPPPPPQPEVKPPEIKEEKIEPLEQDPEPEPEPEPAEAPVSDQLGVDAEGSGAGDSFGLQGKKGGKDITQIKGSGGNGGGGNAFIFYGQHVQRELVAELQNKLRDKARTTHYTAVLHVWIAANGDISKVELQNSSGEAEIDEALKMAMGNIKGRLKPPPERLPQPLKIRIKS